MALVLSDAAAIWSSMLFWVAYMVNAMAFMFRTVWVIFGMSATICGSNSSRRSISGRISCRSPVMRSTPSMASNIDRSDQQTGISKQCGSQ
ncbi:hypothetical protein DE4576_05552 [Mycobacterium marinum]|nr:hypothetical protein DE4576_05552 [Mycobacterium marinum]